ncbi:MAG: hypothetical protein U1A78_34455 [Polyangia bacterium]
MRALGLLAALSLAAACGDPAASTPAAAAGADLGPGDVTAPRARIVGSVVDLERRALPGVRVQLCGAACREFTTSRDGIFEIPDVERGDYGVHLELPAADPLLFGKVVLPLYAFDPKATPVRALPVTVVPRLGPEVKLGAGRQTVPIDGTLALGLDADALKLPPGSGAPRLSGVRVPAALYPDFCLPGGDGRIVAEWALGPFATESSAPIDVHIADSLGLSAGSAVFLSTIDPATGRPDRQGFGRVSADGKSIDSLAMMGIRRLTWLVVSLPGGGA